MIRAAALTLVLGLGACATTPALPDFSVDHPAHPDARESAPPARPTTLGVTAADAAVGAAPAPKPPAEHAGSQHR